MIRSWRFPFIVLLTMASVAAMTVMHEYMHKRTSQKRQPNEHTEDMRSVLGEQECASDEDKPNENKSCPRGQKAALWRFALRGIVYRHR